MCICFLSLKGGTKPLRRLLHSACVLFVFLILFPAQSAAEMDQKEIYQKRMELYQFIEKVTNIPWNYIAAIDQYERNLRYVRKDLPEPNGLTGIYFPPEKWNGPLNPNQEDTNPASIQFFGGMGRDGDGDNKAEPTNDIDVLFSFSNYLLDYGTDLDSIKIGLWDYYKKDKAVFLITNYAKIYGHFQTVDLDERHFPLPLHANYSYRNTWGDARGWGGRRIHEGTDIFAGYGVNVYSTCYGIVEMKGWNKYGGWRIGIRDVNNTYHYFAHLNGFAKDLYLGKIVKPGELIGSVGASGYGPPGTSGKFPPHLHYGMYKYNGRTEWSFDPFPHLKKWERETRKKK